MQQIIRVQVPLIFVMFLFSGSVKSLEQVGDAVKFGYLLNESHLTLRWAPMTGYYVYNVRVSSKSEGLSLFEQQIPSPTEVTIAGRPMSVFSAAEVEFVYLIGALPEGASLDVQFHTCHEGGYCYPPQRYQLNFDL